MDAQCPVAPSDEVRLSYLESIVTGTTYEWFADRETLINIAILQWQESENLRSQIASNKLDCDARESDLQREITENNSESEKRLNTLHVELTARESAHQDKIDDLNSVSAARDSKLKAQMAARKRDHHAEITAINAARDDRERQLLDRIRAQDSAHKANIVDRERAYRDQISYIKTRHKRELEDATADGNNQRRRLQRLQEEIIELNEAKDKLEAQVKAPVSLNNQLLLTLAEIESSISQNAAPASVTAQLPLALEETESSTGETEESSSTETGSRALTPEQDLAETSPQDVAPGTEDQLPSPPAATESLTRDTEEASSAEPVSPASIPTPDLDSAETTAETSPQDVAPGIEYQIASPPAANSSPLTEAEEKLPAQTEGLPEAESTTPLKSGTEQEHEPAETEDLSEVESEQGHEQVQEKMEVEEEPRNSGTLLPEPSSMGEGIAQIPQDQEKGLAQDAPVPTEEQAASLQLTEPEAAPGPTTSDDGASEAPVAMEVEPEEPTGNRETEEPGAVEECAEASADGMDEDDTSPSVEATLKYFGASAIGSESIGEAGASESLTSSPPASGAGIVELDDKMEDALPNEAPADPRMDVDTADDAANDFENKSLGRAGEEPLDSHMGDDGSDDTTNAAGAQPIDGGEVEMAEAPRQDSGDDQGLPPQVKNKPAKEKKVLPSWRDLCSGKTPLLQLIYPNGLGAQPVSNGSVSWNFSRAPTFQRPSPIPQPAQQPVSDQQAPSTQQALPAQRAPVRQVLQPTGSTPPTSPTPQPTPRPATQANPPVASTAKDWPLDNAKTMNTWAVHVNHCSRDWMSRPEFDGNTFQQARDNPESQFSKFILEAENWARYLKTDTELKKSPLSAGAQTVFRHSVPAMRKMREQYSVLSQSKGVPHLFVGMLRDIDYILRELSVLVPESATTTAQHQPPAQSTQQVPSQPTPQTAGTGQQPGNYLYSYGNSLQAAIEIKQRVQEVDQLYLFWEPNTKRDRSGKITSKGTDAEDFAHWDKDYGSRFWAVKRQIRWIANWLENRGQRHPQAEAMLRDQVKPLMKKMRDKTNAIGPMKGCAPLFNDLLGDFVRIVKELNRID